MLGLHSLIGACAFVAKRGNSFAGKVPQALERKGNAAVCLE